MARNYSNTAVATTLTAGVNSSTTSIPVASVSGYPDAPFTAILEPGTASEEVVEVTTIVGSTFTATRGVDGTPAQSHGLGVAVVHGVSARDFSEPNQHPGDMTNVHGIANTANLVTLSGAQTLSGKTLTSPTINGGTVASATLTTPTIASFANATHTHEDDASGGELGAGGSWYGGGDYSAASQTFGASGMTIGDLSLTFTAPSVWPDGATRMVYNLSFNMTATTNTSNFRVNFKDGSTNIDPPGEIQAVGTSDHIGFKTISAFSSLPSAGSHTITVGVDANAAAFSIEKIHLWVYIV